MSEISEIDEISEVINKKHKFSAKITEEIKEKERIIKKSKKGNYETSNLYQKSTPLNQGEFHGILFEGESLKINEKYTLFSFLFQLLKNHLNMNLNVYNTSSEKDVKISKFHKYF